MSRTEYIRSGGVDAEVSNMGLSSGWDYTIREVDGIAVPRVGRFATSYEAEAAMAAEVEQIRRDRAAK